MILNTHMKVQSIYLILIIIVINCNTEQNKSRVISNNPELLSSSADTTLLILESTIGNDDKNVLNKDFLLAAPYDIGVKNNGDIIVFDEERIKIFDNKGKPKKIVGRPGKGPEEFSDNQIIFINNNECIITYPLNGLYDYYSVFSPEYKFLYKKRIDNDPVFKRYINLTDEFTDIKFLIYDNNEKLFEIETFNHLMNIRTYRLIYENNEGSSVLYEVSIPYFNSSITGLVYFCSSNNNIVEYINNCEDEYLNENKGYYRLHLFNIREKKDTYFKKEFIPEQLDIENIISRLEVIQQRTNINNTNIKNELKLLLEKQRYRRAIRCGIMADSKYIYILPLSDLKKGKMPIDIFDIEAKIFLNTIQVPVEPRYIKNGYIYTITEGKEGFPIIQKYKIHPSVYGKK